MEQLIREETQKLLTSQMREARLQRQKQVRQQALAWTEETRRKFELTKEREVKNLASVVTSQVQNAALLNIEQLTLQNDLAMAEIGMAHRAAAGFQNVEKMKALKRLKNEEVANNRGSAAMVRHLMQKEAEKSKRMAILKRKEQVRKAQDRLSKELISRKPLTVSNNANTQPKTKVGPPEYHQSIAKTLKTAPTEGRQQSEAGHPTARKNVKAEMKGILLAVSSSELLLTEKEKEKGPTKKRKDTLAGMVRLRTSSPSKCGIDYEKDDAWEANSNVKDLYGIGYKIRSKYIKAVTGNTTHVPKPIESKVRYFDSTIPKAEVKYIAPQGLAVKETRSSPDAWEKGRKASEESLKHQQDKAIKEKEIALKAEERGKLALKKAKLEKEILKVQNELLEDIEFQLLGTGSQKAILGLDEVDETDAPKPLNENLSSDEFSAVESDEEFTFPRILSPLTLKNYEVIHDKLDHNAVLTLKRRSSATLDNGKVKRSSSTDSFESYSPPSLHSLEGEISKNEKIEVEDPFKNLLKPAANQQIIKEPKGSPPEYIPIYSDIPVSEKIPKLNSKENVDDKPSRKKKSSQEREKPLNAETKSSSTPKLMNVKSDSAHNDQDAFTSSTGSYSSPSFPSSKTSSEEKFKNKEDQQQTSDKPRSKAKDKKSDQQKKKYNGKRSDILQDGSIHGKSANSIMSQQNDDSSSIKGNSTSGESNEKSNSSQGTTDPSSVGNSSGTTIAEINVRTTSTELFPRDHKPSSLQDLHERAKEQEKLLRESPAGSTSTSLSDLQQDSTQSDKKSTRGSSMSKVDGKSTIPSKTEQKIPKQPRQKSSKPKISSKSSSDSDKSSTLVNIKVKQINDTTTTPFESSNSHVSGPSYSNSDESSALLKLKVLENTESTPSRSDNTSSSPTTDYYSPPDGPFTSTPDGKLLPKGSRQRSSRVSSSDSLDSLKRRALQHYLDKFMERRPESIEKLSVTSSSSSVVRIGSDIVESESFTTSDTTDGRRKENELSTRGKNQSISDSSISSDRGLSTLREEPSHADSGSTIAETAVVKIISGSDNSTDLSQIKDESLPTLQQSSSNDSALMTSDSLNGLLKVLSSHQKLEKQQLELLQQSNRADEPEQFSASDNHHHSQFNQNNTISSSRDSIPDASAILRRLRSRQTAHNSSSSTVSSSPKSGPEKEAKRVELLDDATPIKLWETPPRPSQTRANDTEMLAEVFENLIDKWSNMKIEKPPWTPYSDQSDRDGRE